MNNLKAGLSFTKILLSATAIAGFAFASQAQAEELRLLTWGGYAPQGVIEMFKAETGIDVKVTKSNNEEMIAKLRATGGGGFDLVQPSQDRIAGAQASHRIYKSIDLSRIDANQFITSMLEATKANTTYDGAVYGVPHVWGTSGLVLDTTKAGSVKDYTDLCNDDVAGKVSYRLKRPTLIGFAFALGLDPFAAYGDKGEYQAIMDKVEEKLISCKANVKTYWEGGDSLLNLVRSGEVVAAMAWDTGGWKLNNDNPNVTFVAPKSGALGWIDTFALPKKTKNEAGAYKWINFVMRPEIAAMITASAGNFTASKGADNFAEDKLKAQFQDSFPSADLDNIKWYPTVPPGLESIEGKVLDRVKAASAN
ncbi:MAG: extracellular solute-binding protein [Cohaesibacteraceae bacterium]|nr:extracellular solute-binding protein [Cohaesibacteraceae bacterium]